MERVDTNSLAGIQAASAKPAPTPAKAEKTFREQVLEQKAALEAKYNELQALKEKLNVEQGLNPDGSKKSATQVLAETKAKKAADRAALEAEDPLFNKGVKPEAPSGYRYTWIGGANTGSWQLYQNASGGGGASNFEPQPIPEKPTLVRQKTVRKANGIVQTVNVMSDESEVVVDEYKDYSARDAVMQMFENTGLGTTFMNSLLSSIDQVYADNIAPTDAQILNSIYGSEAYKTRFSANETIRKRMEDGKGRPGDRLLSPAAYIETEATYRDIMSSAGLPAGFYDTQEDFTNFIANTVSPDELKARVSIAKSALQNADVNIVNALKSYYGLTPAELTAYLLDKDKAFNLIESKFAFTTAELEKRYTASEVGGAATRAGLTSGVTKSFAEEITAAGKAGEAEQAFQSSAIQSRDYKRLLGLSGVRAGEEDLAREELALAGGTDVSLQKKKLASKERAKFTQRSALDKSSLSKAGTKADV